MDKGWFVVDGIRENGDRTLEQQIHAVRPFLSEANGKTVLDLGCAEGLIAMEFAKAGATDVLGVELIKQHVEVAIKACRNYPQIRFVNAHLDSYYDKHACNHPQFDIVLILGVIHKMQDPSVLLRNAARSSSHTILFRPPIHAQAGVIRSKQTRKRCDVPAVLASEGFFLHRTVHGIVKDEPVECWRRVV